MKKVSAFIGFLLIITLLNSCDYDSIRASDEVTSLDYSIPSYSKLKVANAFNTYVTFSDTEESIRIEANENLHNKIIVKREGSTLHIKLKNFVSVRGNASLNAYIVTKDLSTFDISGASHLTLENEWVIEDGNINLSGASNFTGEIEAERLYIDTSGASNLDLYGSTGLLNGEMSGSSDIRDYDLTIENLDIKLSGASDAYLFVNETIDIKASGASTLNFKGNAVIVNKNLSGASEINNRN